MNQSPWRWPSRAGQHTPRTALPRAQLIERVYARSARRRWGKPEVRARNLPRTPDLEVSAARETSAETPGLGGFAVPVTSAETLGLEVSAAQETSPETLGLEVFAVPENLLENRPFGKWGFRARCAAANQHHSRTIRRIPETSRNLESGPCEGFPNACGRCENWSLRSCPTSPATQP